MQKIVFILFLSLVANVQFGQSCLPQGIQLYTQSDVNNFGATYSICTEIEGDVFIGQVGSDISDLSPLSNINQINGDLVIQHYTQSNDLSAFNNLESVGGNLNISFNDISNASFNSLRNIGGHFIIQGNPILPIINGFSNLETVDDEMQIFANHGLIEINTFDNLQSVGAFLSIHINNSLSNIEGFSALQSVGNKLTISDNLELTNLVGFENLTFVGGNFEFNNNDLFTSLDHFNKLESVGYDFMIRSNALVDSILGFDSLKIIGEDLLLEFNEGLAYLNSFNHLDSITEDISIWGNTILTELIGFDSLIRSDEDLKIWENNSLVDVAGFKNLEYLKALSVKDNNSLESFSGFENFRNTESFVFSRNHSLESFEGFQNLESTSVSFSIDDNDALLNLDKFESLKFLYGYIYIQKNQLLNSIDAISKILKQNVGSTPSNLPDLTLRNNPSLSDCAISTVCHIINSPGKTYDIEANSVGCNSAQEIECLEMGIGGIVYFDANMNGEMDNNEFGIPGQQISIDGINHLTGDNGVYYFYYEDILEYQLEWNTNTDWNLTTATNPYLGTPTGDLDQDYSYLFGLSPNFILDSAKVNLTSQQTRCNTIVPFYLDFSNLGIAELSGQIVLNYDEGCRWFYSTPVPDVLDTINHTAQWSIETLFPYENRSVYMVLAMPDEQSTGDTMNFQSILELENITGQSVIDTSNYSSIVRCSYDPNDKLVNPMGTGLENLTKPGSTLNYTVRFQNTGNAEAIDVFITDVIDPSLDISSLKVNQSSHPVQTTILDDVVRFNFHNIYLPDSLSDPLGSQGFVSFEINPNPNLADPTEVMNTARIFFDENPFIETNTTLTVFGTPTVSVEDQYLNENIKLMPNPADDKISLNLENIDYDSLKLELNDISGKRMMTQTYNYNSKGNTKVELDISAFPSGLFFLSLQTEKGATVKKFIKH